MDETALEVAVWLLQDSREVGESKLLIERCAYVVRDGESVNG